MTSLLAFFRCPVCLERMDSAVTGLVTVPCLHTYQSVPYDLGAQKTVADDGNSSCACLRKWGDSDSRCPVCRYSSKPLHLPPAPGSAHQHAAAHASAGSAPSSCSDCATTESLWLCLICGNCVRAGLFCAISPLGIPSDSLLLPFGRAVDATRRASTLRPITHQAAISSRSKSTPSAVGTTLPTSTSTGSS